MFWIREAILIIGSKKYTLDGLNFSFEIPFEDSDETPVATIKVTNLSPDTRANIKKNDSVILNAGYEGDVGSLLIGKVVGLKHKHNNTDWETTLTVMPCADEILSGQINKTYKRDSKASDIVRDMLNIFGVEVAKCVLTNDTTYPRGRVCRGKLKQVLTDIIVKECKSRFIVRPTGQLYITQSSDSIDNGLVLSPETGLLRADKEIEAIPYEKTSNTKKTKDKKEEEEVKTISRSCLLNYKVTTAETITFQSSDLNGRYTVVSGKHVGDRNSNWKTEMELVPYGTKINKKKSK